MSVTLAQLIEARIAAAVGDTGPTLQATIGEATRLAEETALQRARLGPGDAPDLAVVIAALMRHDAG